MSASCPVRAHAVRTPDAPALVEGDRAWTYAELDADVSAWAARLRARGVESGDRIAVLSRNRAELVSMFHATARVGAVWVPLNARLTAAELTPQLQRIRPRWIFAEEELSDRAPGVESMESARRPPAPEVDGATQAVEPRSVRAVLFTSGTAGSPKGAELTFESFEASARGSAANLGGGPDQRWLACLPLFHVGGLAMVHRCAAYGACLVLHRRFDAAEVARDLTAQRISHLSLVPTTLVWLLDAWDGRAPTSLRAILVGGAPLSVDLAARARSRGFPVMHTYGLTEACSQVTTERLAEADGRTAGPPLEGVRVRIRGELGEIQVRGPTVMRGYLDDPVSTAEAFDEGWLRTGDLGALDSAGRLTVAARRSDLILSGGENVYPAEVEAALASHPEVAEVAVVGVGDGRWDQVPVALCVPRDRSRALDARALEQWCRERLAGFKVPKRFVALAELAKSESGKLDRAWARTVAAGAAGACGAGPESTTV
ncbi:MAG TPA: o-succinylbenzoate--CoA ligase [Myxococcaceae bacterium]|nr:o-succinylbenzoate--CoA ligase [Myxococcaceae bacterium]